MTAAACAFSGQVADSGQGDVTAAAAASAFSGQVADGGQGDMTAAAARSVVNLLMG
jgi:hypothetical protein